MSGPGSSSIGARRGVAAVEFALVAPVLLMLLGGVADYGLLMNGKGQLANGIAQGVQYALLQGPSVSGTTVKTIVQSAVIRSGVTAAVTVTITGPTCYCVSSYPVALSIPSASALSSSNTCTASGSCTAPAPFLIISASYTYQPLMPFYSKLASTTVSQTATARLQ
jgi:Flp pilus assembly protein TadG